MLSINIENESFECSKCEYKSHDKNSLLEHEWYHSGEKPFQCKWCDFTAGKKENIKQHERHHIEAKRFECTFCNYKTCWEKNLKRHAKVHIGDKPLNCKLCEYHCSLKTDLQRHERTHREEKPFECSSCKYKVTTKALLNLHERIHHTRKKPYTSAFKSALKKHEEGYIKGKPYRCTWCKYKTSNADAVQWHEKVQTGEIPFHCRWCKSFFLSGMALEEIHEQKNLQNEQLKSITFNSNCNLTQQRNHSSVIFYCSRCDYQTDVESLLKIHENEHVENQILKCSSDKIQLEEIGSENKSSEIFSCRWCKYKNISQNVIKWHEKVHTKKKIFGCRWCEFSSNFLSAIRAHEKIHEKEEKLQKSKQLESITFHSDCNLAQQNKQSPTFYCSRCDYKTDIDYLLKVHESEHVKNEILHCLSNQIKFEVHEDVCVENKSFKSFRCRWCRYKNISQDAIKWHEKIHTGEKHFHCRWCKFSCNFLSGVKAHEKIHENEEKLQSKQLESVTFNRNCYLAQQKSQSPIIFYCSRCDYKTDLESLLKVHENEHVENQILQCSSDEIKLEVHEDICVEKKSFETFHCRWCRYKSNSQGAMKWHEKVHIEEKPFHCRWCNFSCILLSGIKAHEKIHAKKKKKNSE